MIETVALWVAMPLLSLAIILTFIRLVLGPTLPDRVVALDLLTLLSVGMAVVYAMAHNQQRLLDLAIVLALIAFPGTIAFARYLEKATLEKEK